jgi:hypothetical protein
MAASQFDRARFQMYTLFGNVAEPIVEVTRCAKYTVRIQLIFLPRAV